MSSVCPLSVRRCNKSSTPNSRGALFSEQDATRVAQILFIAKPFNQFVGKWRDFALQIGRQIAIDFSPRIRRELITAAQRILNQTCEFRRRGSAKLHCDCGRFHERVVLLPHPEFVRGRSQRRLAYEEGSSYAVTKALH